MDAEEQTTDPGWRRVVVTVVACAAIVGLSALTVGVIWLTEPEAQREGAVKRTAMLVETVTADSGDFRPVLTAMGTVRATEDIVLQPRVSGQVLEVGDGFVPGQVVPRGERLVRIDPADAHNLVAQRRSALAQAEAALAIEQGRRAAAQTERAQFEGEVSPAQDALITRAPQLKSAQASVEAARAVLRQAELDLARTQVRAPVDALVLERTTSVGSQVTPSTTLGRLVGVHEFWVELTLPARSLGHLPLDDLATETTPVLLQDRVAWSPEVFREGRLKSVVRQVDTRTRLARLLVSVADPLALQATTSGPPLTVGAWVEVQLQAETLQDVVRLDRGLLRKGDTVWELDDDSRLRIREVEVLIEDAAHVYIGAGLEAGATVVTTDLATVVDGAALRTRADPP